MACRKVWPSLIELFDTGDIRRIPGVLLQCDLFAFQYNYHLVFFLLDPISWI